MFMDQVFCVFEKGFCKIQTFLKGVCAKDDNIEIEKVIKNKSELGGSKMGLDQTKIEFA